MKWRTKDGRIIDIKTMETAHIKNCVAMLEKAGYVSIEDFSASVSAMGSLNGEYAQMAAENEVWAMKPVATLDAFYNELSLRMAV